MAAPTAPTLATITTEGLTKAGYSGSQLTAKLSRAQDEWMEEIKAELFQQFRASNIMTLEVESFLVTTIGQSRYANPEEAKSLSLVIMDGNDTGTAQDGAANSVTLAAADTFSSDSRLGKNIAITAGTGKGSVSQCTAYDDSTKVATVTPNFNTAPAASSTYMWVDEYRPLVEMAHWAYDKLLTPNARKKPMFYYPRGDGDYGEFRLDSAPDKAYPMRKRYIADLTRADLSGTTLATLYRRWRSLFTYGVAWKAAEDRDDSKAQGFKAEYERQKALVGARDAYGMAMSNLQATVSDY